MAYKLEIKDVLRNIDKRNFEYYDSLTDEEKKGFAGPVVLRFMSSSANADYPELSIFQVNEIANLHFYDLYEHPELQYKLLASCGGGYVVRHEWIPMVKPAVRMTAIHDFLQELHPSANDFELDLIFKTMTRADLIELIADCALSSDRSKTLLNVYEKHQAAKKD